MKNNHSLNDVFEGVITETIQIENKATLEWLLSHSRIHINDSIRVCMESTPQETGENSLDVVKINLSDELYDSELLCKANLQPLVFSNFISILCGLLSSYEENRFKSMLCDNGTRSDPPSNVFYVEHDGKVANFTLWQDKNSDGNTFLHWYLYEQPLGKVKISPQNTVVFAKKK